MISFDFLSFFLLIVICRLSASSLSVHLKLIAAFVFLIKAANLMLNLSLCKRQSFLFLFVSFFGLFFSLVFSGNFYLKKEGTDQNIFLRKEKKKRKISIKTNVKTQKKEKMFFNSKNKKHLFYFVEI